MTSATLPTHPRQRQAVLMTSVMAIICLISSALYLLLALQAAHLGLGLLALAVLVMVGPLVYAARQAQRGALQQGGYTILIALSIISPFPLLIFNDLLALVIVIDIMVMASVTAVFLEDQARGYGLLLLLTTLLVVVLVEDFAQGQGLERIGIVSIPFLGVIMPVLGGVVALIVSWQTVSLYLYSESIRTRLVIAFSAVALVPILLISGASIALNLSSGQSQVNDKLQTIASLQRQQIQTWQNILLSDLQALAVQNQLDILQSLGLGSSASVTIRRTQDQLRSTLRQAADERQRFSDIFLLDMQGEVIVASNRVFQGRSLAQEAFFAAGLAEQSFTPLYRSAGLGQPVLMVQQLIPDAQGQAVGLLAGLAQLSGLDALLSERAGLGETGHAYLLSAEGLLVSQLHDFTALESLLDVEGLQAALRTRSSGTLTYEDASGQPVLGAYAWLEEPGLALLVEQEQREALAQVESVALLNAGLALLGLSFAAFVALLVTRNLSRPIVRLAQAARSIRDGNLNTQADVDRRDELGQLAEAFNGMTATLRDQLRLAQDGKAQLENTVATYAAVIQKIAEGDLRSYLVLDKPTQADDDLYHLGEQLNEMTSGLGAMASQVRQVAASVTQAADEIQAATTQQMAATVEQDASVTQTAATVEQVRATVRQTAERAQAVARAAQEALQIAHSGQQSLNDTFEGMTLIRQRAQSIAETILLLAARTQQIGEIINSVNDIADQSKLLALNASIEAARAGAEGKGFAVVALEVRKLAEQSRSATARIRTILQEIQKATQAAVVVSEDGNRQTQEGLALVERAAEVIRRLAATIEQSSQSAVQIAASTQQQTNGMDQLAAAMHQIRQASTQTAAAARQTEQSVRSLIAMASELEAAAARYKLREGL